MLKARFIAAILGVVFLSVATPLASEPPTEQPSDSEYAVLSRYVTREFTGDRAHARVGETVSRIVIADTTEPDSFDAELTDDNDRPLSWDWISRQLRKQAPPLRKQTLDAFRAVDVRSKLQRKFHLPLPYDLVRATDVDAIFKSGGWWDEYYRRFPGAQGFLRLSRVGFSPDGTQAMFYAANRCGGKCGTGTYVVMRKVGSDWKIVKEILMWIS